MTDRLPCGCPDMDTFLDPCPGHVWSHWHPHARSSRRASRFCFYCGDMETQTLESQ